LIANATVHDIRGYAPVYAIPAFSLVSDWELGLYLLLGLGAGHLAPLSLRLLERTHQLFRRLPLMLAVVTAHYRARRHTGLRPMYADSLLPRETGSPEPLASPTASARISTETGVPAGSKPGANRA
jgi:hypothetical protein